MKERIMTWMGLLLMVLAGCVDDRNDHLLAGAEACMETRADSARWLLQQMDSVLTDKQQARYALLWTQAMHKCHIPFGSDSLINMAVDYYGRKGERHSLAKALLYKGLVHKQHGEVEAAAEAFVAGEQAFEGVEDNQYKALLCSHYALLLMQQNLLDKSLEYYKKTYQYRIQGDSIHYIVSTCSQIARGYILKDMQDSANIYYKKGMSYVKKCQFDKRIGMFLQNYAAFLINSENYDEAEQILKECEEHPVDSSYIYNVYSCFATLYYETKEYGKALPYAEKLLESGDSLMQCGGYLHLYRIHKRLGELEKAVRYHDLYRWYDNDITLRRKTTEVAEIPHRMKAFRLEEENRTAHRWQWGWGIGVIAVSAMAVYVVKVLRRRYGKQLEVKDSLLDRKEQLLAEKQILLRGIEKKLYDLKVELGRMKGAISNQSKVLETLKDGRKKDRDAYHESVKEFRKNMKEKDEEHRADRKAGLVKYRELAKRLEMSEKEQKHWIGEVEKLSGKMGQYELQQRFLLDNGDVRAVLLVQALKTGCSNMRYPIKRAEYAELLKQLAEYAYPGIRQQIETDDTLKDKQELACLLVLGYDNMEMLCMATNLKENSVRTYMTQVRKVLKGYVKGKG